jgi:hypothetical protein
VTEGKVTLPLQVIYATMRAAKIMNAQVVQPLRGTHIQDQACF